MELGFGILGLKELGFLGLVGLGLRHWVWRWLFGKGTLSRACGVIPCRDILDLRAGVGRRITDGVSWALQVKTGLLLTACWRGMDKDYSYSRVCMVSTLGEVIVDGDNLWYFIAIPPDYISSSWKLSTRYFDCTAKVETGMNYETPKFCFLWLEDWIELMTRWRMKTRRMILRKRGRWRVGVRRD